MQRIKVALQEIWQNIFNQNNFAWLKKKTSKMGLNFRLINLVPYTIFAILFIVLPFILLLQNATSSYEGPGSVSNEIKSWNFFHILGESIWTGLLAAVISLLLMFPFVWLVSRSRHKGFKITALVLMVSPLLVFTLAKVFAIKGLLLMMFDSAKYNNLFVKEVGMIYLYSPFMVVPLYSVLSTMPKSLLEASSDLGQGIFKTIIRVVLPYAMKGIFTSLALVFMLAATNIVVTQSLYLGGTSAPKMVGNLINDQASRVSGSNLAKITASTMALITIAIMILVYGSIQLLPQLIRKLRGGVNV